MVFALLQACAPSAQTPNGVQQPAARSPEPEALDHVVVTSEEALGADELLARADAALTRGRYADALADYERLLRVERMQRSDALPSTERRWVAQALFGAGTAQDMLGQREEALRFYGELMGRFPEAPSSRTGAVRSVRLLVHLERFEEAGSLARGILARSSRLSSAPRSAGNERQELGPLERIALYSASALEHVVRQDDEGAMSFVARGRRIVDAHGFDRDDTLPRDLAQLYFALGEVRRLRAERLVFDPLPANFAATLEERCQLLLDAQSAYSDVMRAHDAHWSAMAGFRVGELYQKLHEDLMKVSPPSSADSDDRRALFEGAMRLRYSILLRKARTMLTHTLHMVERTGYETRWAAKAREAQDRIEAALTAEEAALDRLPYTRGELQAALDHLQREAEQANSGSRSSSDP